MKLDNKVIFVSGANRGIGKAVVEALLKQPVKKIYAAARKVDSLLDRHHFPGKADPFIERVLAQIGNGCESLNAALSAEELMISPRGYLILRDDPAVTSERSDGH